MSFLILSILCSTSILITFKIFEQFEVNTFQAIVVNYIVCVLCAAIILGQFPFQDKVWETDYFYFALGCGFIFISGFMAIGLTVQKFGITLATILNKISIIFSAAFAIWMYQESINIWKISGIIVAIAAIVLVNIPNETSPFRREKITFWLLILPVYTFFSAVLADVLLQFVEVTLLETSGDPFFIALVFGTAGTMGLIYGLIRQLFRWHMPTLLGGMILGIANFGSVYFFLKTLGLGWEGSIVFPINNVGIILLSTGIAYLFFREKLTTINLIGVTLAVVAIGLIGLGVGSF